MEATGAFAKSRLFIGLPRAVVNGKLFAFPLDNGPFFDAVAALQSWL
jgi:hypothetical protein